MTNVFFEQVFNGFNSVFCKLNAVAVDKDAYFGDYYEVMRMPTNFQSDGTSSMAGYSANPDGSIKVFNRAFSDNFTTVVDTIEGVAVPYADESGKLSVSFPSIIPQQLQFAYNFFGIPRGFPAPYWVIKLGEKLTNQQDPNLNGKYSYAIVSSPGLSFCWVLSRFKPNSNTYNTFIQTLRDLGFGGKEFLVPYATTAKILI
jgi:lipocalin